MFYFNPEDFLEDINTFFFLFFLLLFFLPLLPLFRRFLFMDCHSGHFFMFLCCLHFPSSSLQLSSTTSIYFFRLFSFFHGDFIYIYFLVFSFFYGNFILNTLLPKSFFFLFCDVQTISLLFFSIYLGMQPRGLTF